MKYRICREASPDGIYLCTVRIPEVLDTHTGDHVAEGRAHGEPDSVVATWVQ